MEKAELWQLIGPIRTERLVRKDTDLWNAAMLDVSDVQPLVLKESEIASKKLVHRSSAMQAVRVGHREGRRGS